MRYGRLTITAESEGVWEEVVADYFKVLEELRKIIKNHCQNNKDPE